MTKTYEQGVIDGKILAIEETLGHHNKRLNDHSGRIRGVEKLQWMILGALVIIELLPNIVTFIGQ